MVPNDARELFSRTFGAEPELVASAPGRVNLIGEHTDYNGGQVLPIGIERRTYVAVRRSNNGSWTRAVSGSQGEEGKFDVGGPTRSGGWWDYISGVAAEWPTALPQLDIAVVSDVPAGAGLSSSASLEVATARAIAAVMGQTNAASPRELAAMAWRAETGFVGVECGIMDQFASALAEAGHALHLWCDTKVTEQVPFQSSVLVFDTGVSRSLRGSEFNTRREECRSALSLLRLENPRLENLSAATREDVLASGLPEPLLSRALHVTTENERVAKCVAHLGEHGTLPGGLLYDSHSSLRDLYECSSPELDWFVDRAMREPGIEGARLTGAGWGGCAIAVGDPEALKNAAAPIAAEYEATFHIQPRVWITAAAPGMQTA